MELFLAGLANIFYPKMLLLIWGGTFLGMVVGALPGLSATMGVAILLPVTFYLPPDQGICLLLGIYTGGIYGGSISAILLNIPGCPASLMTTLDGYPMSSKGEGGRAIGLATTCSFLGGMFGVLALILFGPVLAGAALGFGPPEYAMLAFFGLSAIVVVAARSIVKGFIGVMIGLLMATVGMDPVVSVLRFTYGSIELMSGIGYIPVVIGLFGLTEVITQALDLTARETIKQKVGRVVPSLSDFKIILRNMFHPTWIGILIGALPGAGGSIASIISYNRAVQASKEPERFGTGIPEGIISCETANNASIGGSMVPLLSLGIPGSSVAAVLLGAMMMHNILPGPMLFVQNGELVHTLFAGMAMANVAMLILGLAAAKVSPKIVNLPKSALLPTITVLCAVGAYAINNSLFDVGIMLVCGVAGFFLKEFGISAGPIILGLILGPIAEENFRGALEISGGNLSIFITKPISLTILILTLALLVLPFMKKWYLSRKINIAKKISDVRSS